MFENLTVVDDIIYLKIADYTAAVNHFVSEVSVLPGVYFIGQFGSVDHPGISDLDILVVVEDEYFKETIAYCKKLIREIPHGQYLFWHDPMVIPRSLVHEAATLHSLDGLQPLAGDKSLVFSLPLSRKVKMINQIIWNSYIWSIILDMGYYRRHFGVRGILLILNMVCKSIMANFQAAKMTDHAPEIISQVKEVRKSAIQMHSLSSKIVSLLRQAVTEFAKSDWVLQDYFQTKSVGNNETIEYDAGKYIFEFSRKNLNQFSPQRESYSPWVWRIKKPRFILPWFYAEIISSLRGPYGIVFPQVNFSMDKDWRDAIEEYGATIQRVRDFERKNGLSLFDHPFITPFGLISAERCNHTLLYRIRRRVINIAKHFF